MKFTYQNLADFGRKEGSGARDRACAGGRGREELILLPGNKNIVSNE